MSAVAPGRRRRGRGTAAIALWLLALAAAAVVAARSHYVADLSAFLPAAPTPEQAVLVDQLKSGAATRLVLVGIDGGDAEARAAASRALAEHLRASGLFTAVNNGDRSAFEAAGRVVFVNRYLLSPAVDADRFSVDGLRAALGETVSLLGTPAGALVKPILFEDPTGETIRLVEALTPATAPRSEGGVWASRSEPRAVLVAITRADGSDLDGQQRALETLRSAFARIAPPTLHLQVSGPGSFGVAARERITAEVERLAIAGTVMLVAFLLVAFGSLRALGVALLPVATGVLAGIAAVSLGFGQVHGMTLGFGATLIGEAVDYAIYYLIQASAPAAAEAVVGNGKGTESRNGDGESAGLQRWLSSSWPTVRLGLFTSLIGFAALLFSGFPGLAQLGVFSIAGLAAAAATTRFVLPTLAPRGVAGRGLRHGLGRVLRRATALLARARLAFAALAVAALVALVALPSPWHGSLAALSPVGAEALALDAGLRADVGAADGGTLIAVSAADEAAALAGAEAVGARLDRLVQDGALAGYESPAKLLPSPETQARRRAALPPAVVLRERLVEATAGGPLPADRLEPFVDAVQRARDAPLLSREALAGTPLAAALDALLVPGSGERPWRALLSVQAPGTATLDAAGLRAAVDGIPGVHVVAIGSELDALYARYLRDAMWQAGLGGLAVLALLAVRLRDARRLARVAVPTVAAAALVVAVLSAAGVALGILHLVGVLLTVAIGSNYALFFDHLRAATRPGDAELGARAGAGTGADDDTLASLLLANLTTVAAFGLLATSAIPVLQAIGIVVAPGALLALVFSAALIGPAAPPLAHGRIPGP